MKVRTTLDDLLIGSIGIAGITIGTIMTIMLTVGNSSYSNQTKKYTEYTYSGQIGEEKVTFGRECGNLISSYDCLIVDKPSKKVMYLDSKGKDLKIDEVVINHGFYGLNFFGINSSRYTLDDEVGRSIVEDAQKKFDSYLKVIKEKKLNAKETKLKLGLDELE